MHTLKLAIIGLAFGSTATIAGECSAPATPELADGAAATMEQMLAGQKAVKTFQAANLEYMACLDPMVTAAGKTAKADSDDKGAIAALKELEAKYNAAVSQEEEVAGQFNSAIKAYKAANPS